jgi:hypothetical protein
MQSGWTFTRQTAASSNISLIVSQMHFDAMSFSLVRAGIITPRDVEEVKAASNGNVRRMNEYFVNYLMRQPFWKFQAFVQCLRQSGDGILAHTLEQSIRD